MSGAVRVGFFGKLPSRGDFVRAGLSRELVAAWDGWLQRVMPMARERAGERWAQTWSAVPAWRFELSAGLCGPRAASGLWLPSRDSVGRDFPLLVAAEPACASAAFLDAAERAAADALAGAAAPGDLARRLAALPPPAAAAGPSPVCGTGQAAARWWVGGSAERALHGDALPGADMFLDMLAA